MENQDERLRCKSCNALLELHQQVVYEEVYRFKKDGNTFKHPKEKIFLGPYDKLSFGWYECTKCPKKYETDGYLEGNVIFELKIGKEIKD